jgi:hypothetical protein
MPALADRKQSNLFAVNRLYAARVTLKSLPLPDGHSKQPAGLLRKIKYQSTQ